MLATVRSYAAITTKASLPYSEIDLHHMSIFKLTEFPREWNKERQLVSENDVKTLQSPEFKRNQSRHPILNHSKCWHKKNDFIISLNELCNLQNLLVIDIDHYFNRRKVVILKKRSFLTYTSVNCFIISLPFSRHSREGKIKRQQFSAIFSNYG